MRLNPFAFLKRRLSGGSKPDVDDELVRSRFVLIGMTAVLWAKMEGALDACNDLAFEIGGNAFEDKLPQALNRKLRFMRKCHNELPELSPLKAAADKLVERAHFLKKRRHDLIHGIALELPAGDIMEFLRLSHGTEGLSIERITVTNEDLSSFAADAMDLFDLAEDHFVAMANLILVEGKKNQDGGLAD